MAVPDNLHSTTVAATFLRPGLTIITLFEYGVYRHKSPATCRWWLVLNGAARLFVDAGKFDQYDHITPVLHDVLHWLYVPQ